MKAPEDSYFQAIRNAKQAINRGDRLEARRWAQMAAHLSPDREDSWLILASVSSPVASIEYIKRAQSINPQSEKVKAAMAWAENRQKSSQPSSNPPPKNLVDPQINKQSFIQFKTSPILWGLLIVFFILSAGFWGRNSQIISKSEIVPTESIPIVDNQFDKETRTPTSTPTATQTPLPTSTPIPTATLVPTSTQPPTATPTNVTKSEKKKKKKKKQNQQVNNNKQVKTKKQTKVVSAPSVVHRPGKVGNNQRWVDIDLSSQRAYAYVGDEMVKGFIVSTGTWQHPTVTGVFRVYVKYRAADMSGSGYYLPDVPYVMYFYNDYGMHGTYWHHNFGTPMSHGCVNFATADAAWLYNFSSIGTVVNIHK